MYDIFLLFNYTFRTDCRSAVSDLVYDVLKI